jgi:hypothetical protein
MKKFLIVLAASAAFIGSASAYTSGGNHANSVKVDANGVKSHMAAYGADFYPRWDRGYCEARVIHLAPNGCPFDGTKYDPQITKQVLGFQGSVSGYVLNASAACKHSSQPNR